MDRMWRIGYKRNASYSRNTGRRAQREKRLQRRFTPRQIVSAVARNEMPIRVVLADDHALVRQGLKALLELEGFQVVGEASDGQEAVRLLPSLHPDVAVLDISMPLLNGVDAARELQKASPKTKIILLTRHDEDQYVTESVLRKNLVRLKPQSFRVDIHDVARLRSTAS